ncbi:MAG: hypothetical protein RR573_09265, partial [Oscillospiraceae bacterium]
MQNIKKQLNSAFDELPCASFDVIANTNVCKMQQHDSITAQPSRRKINIPRINKLALAFAAVAIIVGTVMYNNLAVDNIITIDVNPSFEITTNKSDHVLLVKALNDDAQSVLAGKKFKGWELDDAIETLFTDMGKTNFITQQKNTVLLSVSNKDTKRTKSIEHRIAAKIESAFAGTDIKPHIVAQALTKDKLNQEEALQNHVSSGKMQVVHKVRANNSQYSIEQLATMP